MFKKINEDGGVTLWAIEIKDVGCITKVHDIAAGDTTMFIPGVKIGAIREGRANRRELVKIDFDSKGFADNIAREVQDILGGDIPDNLKAAFGTA